MLSLAFYNAIDIYKHLNLKTGVVSYWERTGGKYNTATMNIKYDSNTYTTERFGGWLWGCVKIDTSSLFFLHLVYHIIRYLL